jgi:dTMP kinase
MVMNIMEQFIALEGIDGSGKSTLIKFLYRFLKMNTCKDVLVTKSPGLKKIRELVEDPNITDPLTNLFLFCADRREESRKIKTSLEKGEWVLSDRFSLSTYAYQRNVGQNALGFLDSLVDPEVKPFYFLLDVEPETAFHRLSNRGDAVSKFETLEQLEYHRSRYLELAKSYPNSIYKVDANRSETKVAKSIFEKVKELYGEPRDIFFSRSP